MRKEEMAHYHFFPLIYHCIPLHFYNKPLIPTFYVRNRKIDFSFKYVIIGTNKIF